MVYAVAIVASLLAAFPFIVEGIITFKRDQDLYAPGNNPFVYNLDPTTEHLDYLFTSTGFLTFVGNTLLVGGCVVAITLLLALPRPTASPACPCAGAAALGITIFLVYLIPPSLLFVSFSRLVADLGLQNSRWALVVLYPTITVPVSVWLLLGFFKSIPRDIEEQAMVDGYSRLAAFCGWRCRWRSRGSWRSWSSRSRCRPTSSSTPAPSCPPAGEDRERRHPHRAGPGRRVPLAGAAGRALLVALPIALVFSLLLNRFVSGFTMGAVKG